MDDLIVSLLTSCKQLENIHYEGILRDFETLRDVCQLQLDSKTRELLSMLEKINIDYFLFISFDA